MKKHLQDRGFPTSPDLPNIAFTEHTSSFPLHLKNESSPPPHSSNVHINGTFYDESLGLLFALGFAFGSVFGGSSLGAGTLVFLNFGEAAAARHKKAKRRFLSTLKITNFLPFRLQSELINSSKDLFSTTLISVSLRANSGFVTLRSSSDIMRGFSTNVGPSPSGSASASIFKLSFVLIVNLDDLLTTSSPLCQVTFGSGLALQRHFIVMKVPDSFGIMRGFSINDGANPLPSLAPTK
uniref:Uncharacterized protein n=1 Tax=Glossina brevipalpis TaxID=37001 RepID=A0A1A9WYF3_9MUSC